MQVHMMNHGLSPGVQCRGHAHLPVQALGVSTEGFDGVPDTVEQAPVQRLGM